MLLRALRGGCELLVAAREPVDGSERDLGPGEPAGVCGRLEVGHFLDQRPNGLVESQIARGEADERSLALHSGPNPL